MLLSTHAKQSWNFIKSKRFERTWGNFTLTKPEGKSAVEEGVPSTLMLILKGKVKGKEQVEKSFREVFGKPKTVIPAQRFIGPQILTWDTAKALASFSCVFWEES